MQYGVCRSASHEVSRRTLLANMLAGASGMAATGIGAIGGFANPAVAAKVEAKQKQVLIILLNGGLSQFESFDPKPKTAMGGPFRAIPTSVPGTHFCELLPYTARQAHRLAVVRSVFRGPLPPTRIGRRAWIGRGPGFSPAGAPSSP